MRNLDDATYVPGSWVAISAANGCLLVDLVAADPVVRRCWKLLSEDAGADAVLDALAAGGIAAAPSFALLVRTETGHRAVVRHPASITIHSAGQEQREIDAATGTSWTDVALTVTSLDAVMLVGAPADASVELPMGAGVTMASVVQLRPGAPDALPVRTNAATPPRPVPFPRDAETVVVPAAVDAPPLPPSVPTEAAAAAAAPDESAESYDHLFGASVQRPVAPPAPRAPVTADTAGWHTVVPPPEGVPTPAADGLIEGVPWASADDAADDPAPPTAAFPPPEPPRIVETTPDAETVTVPAVDASSYGATINRAQLRAEAQAAAGPTVLAGRCPNGHLSPPHADRCRVCRAPMPEQDAFEIGRPVLGVLRLQSGDLVTLDRGVLLGRSPDVPTGGDRPHVLRLKSPDNDISRNHAEIVLDGWNVSVRDLGSTNGTVVQLPGRAPVRLRENEPALLENGATVTLADEVTLVFEVQA